jgi:O-acetyl-ADP-ribose deacetylase (regulator of RNase III)
MTDGQAENSRRIIRVVYGDLFKQNVEILVNPWTCNRIPYRLLPLRGVAAALMTTAGEEPFRELGETGTLALGEATLTGAGRLKGVKGIVHVAVRDHLQKATIETVRSSAQRAMRIVNELGFGSVAFPLLGTGSGHLAEEEAYLALTETLAAIETSAEVRIVRYRPEPPDKTRTSPKR